MILDARCWFWFCSLVLGHGVVPERLYAELSVDGLSAVVEKFGAIGDVLRKCVHYPCGSLDTSDSRRQGQERFSGASADTSAGGVVLAPRQERPPSCRVEAQGTCPQTRILLPRWLRSLLNRCQEVALCLCGLASTLHRSHGRGGWGRGAEKSDHLGTAPFPVQTHEPARSVYLLPCFFFVKGFGFMTPDDGGDDVFIYWKELAVEGLQQGDTVSYDAEYDDRKRNYRARHCIVISGSGGGGGTPGDGGDDVFIHHQQLFDTGDTGPCDTEYD